MVQHVIHGNRNAVERIFREVTRRTSQFSNTFSHVEPSTAEKLVTGVRFRMEPAYLDTTTFGVRLIGPYIGGSSISSD